MQESVDTPTHFSFFEFTHGFRKGSFGAVIAAQSDSAELGTAAELSGVALGADPGSFRAEAYGILKTKTNKKLEIYFKAVAVGCI